LSRPSTRSLHDVLPIWPGTAHVRVGKREVQAVVMEGASSVSLDIDVEAGPIDLEAWFGGQLPGERKIGAIYATIERVGDRRDFRSEEHTSELQSREKLV